MECSLIRCSLCAAPASTSGPTSMRMNTCTVCGITGKVNESLSSVSFLYRPLRGSIFATPTQPSSFACARLQAGLTGESQEVVPIEARAADRWSMVETTMRTMPVVVMKPGEHVVIALARGLIRAGIDPLPKSSLDKALGLAIGARGIGASEVVAQAELNTSLAEGMGAVAVAVVGEQAADANAQRGVIGQAVA